MNRAVDILNVTLLAEIDSFREISQYMRHGGHLPDLSWFIAGVCGIVILWIGLRFFDKYWSERGLTSHDPRALFGALCDAHGLNRHERKLLDKAAPLAEDAGCHLFIDPRYLGRLAMAQSSDADDYAALSQKLFGESAG